MWSLRRASIRLKNQGFVSGGTRLCSSKSDINGYNLKNSNYVEPQSQTRDTLLSTSQFYTASSFSSKSYSEIRTFSSQAGPKSSGEDGDDLDDGFSDLENPQDLAQDSISGDESNDGSVSESDGTHTEGDVDELDELDGTHMDPEEKKSRKNRATSSMTIEILSKHGLPVSKALDKWVEEGNEVTQTEVSLTMLELRKRRMFTKALQLSEWLESGKHIDFVEANYASRVDLIAKIRGIFKAEDYIQQIPESFRGELVYRTLLANCVAATNLKKSEDVLKKMKSLDFPITSFTCNQLLLLYKRTDKKKIADVLLLMEKQNIKPDLITYQILIDIKGQLNDIEGMEKIVETMKDEGLKLNSQILSSLARHYVSSGHKDKALAILKELEGEGLDVNRWSCRLLLPIYASLGKENEVERIWKICDSDPGWEECMAAIEAWGQLKRIEKAEGAFEKMVKRLKRPSSKHFAALLKVYANHKMLTKGKDLVKRMSESGCTVGPVTWDALVKLYVGSGEVEKADSLLEKAVKNKRGRPLFNSYFAILDAYAKKGDVHNAEKIFLKMRLAGYVSRIPQYQTLLKAYVNAKVPAYGFRERMRGDNVFPSKEVNGQLLRMDVFKKSAVDELLE